MSFSHEFQMKCPTCTWLEFEFDTKVKEEERIYKCTNCGSEISYEAMIKGNMEEINDQIKTHVDDELKKMFKKFKFRR